MRILFFMTVLGGGGAEMHFARLVSELPSYGIEPIIATLRGNGDYEHLLSDKVSHYVLPTGKLDSTVWKLTRAIRPLSKMIDELRPDVFCPVLSLTSIPGIISAARARHDPAIVLSIQNALGKQVFVQKTPIAIFQRILLPRLWRKADGIIALSRGVAQDISEHIPSSNGKIEVIHNCGKPLDQELKNIGFDPPDRPDDRPVLIAVGRLTPQKDYPTLLKALSMMKTDPAPILWILGAGEDEAELRAMAKKLGLAERVQFLGFRRDVLAYMKAADLFVLSSRWEGFANVIVEAMAAGTPVVSTDCPHGPSEIITDGVNGRLVPVGDSIRMSEALDSALKDKKLLGSWIKAGKARAENFSANSIAAEYSRAFHSLARKDARRQEL